MRQFEKRLRRLEEKGSGGLAVVRTVDENYCDRPQAHIDVDIEAAKRYVGPGGHVLVVQYETVW